MSENWRSTTMLKTVPANVQDVVVEVKEETKTSLSIKANWKLDKAAEDRADWDLLFNDEANVDHFEILYKNGEEGRISEIARTTQWAVYVGDIIFENADDQPFIGVRAVSTDLKTYSPIEWVEVARADQDALPVRDDNLMVSVRWTRIVRELILHANNVM